MANEGEIDRDPLALLPGEPVAISNLEARTFFEHGALGRQLAPTAKRWVPLGDESGFDPARDLDRVTLGSYATQGIDVVAVLHGRFEPRKIESAAEARSGGVVVSSKYAGRTLYTVNNIGFTVLTERTVLSGTEQGIRRALDRIRDGQVKRSILPWMAETLETPGAALAVAVDLTNHPAAGVALKQLNVSTASEHLKAARLVGNFAEPGMQLAFTLTFDSEEQARVGASSIQGLLDVGSKAAMFGLLPKLRDVELKAEAKDVKCKLLLDDAAVVGLLSAAKPYLGGQ